MISPDAVTPYTEAALDRKLVDDTICEVGRLDYPKPPSGR